MLSGLDPRLVKKAMKKMGIKQEEIEAEAVLIKTKDKEIVINNPSVAKINFGGEISFQISGSVEEKEIKEEAEISEEDIKIIMEQTSCTKEEAEKALKQSKGDIAKAILLLKENKL